MENLVAARPEVSVVLPAYNGERFVRAAVESVLAQTFRDFELIVVDDGSTDGTPAILQELQRLDARLTVHRHPRNLGMRAALNHGCRLASGPLVAKMSHDDICMPLRFERQVAFLRAHPDVGVVGSSVQLIDGEDRRGRIQKYPTHPVLVAWSMLFFNAVAHPAVMMRREHLDAPDAYPEGCLGGTEDYALFSRLSQSSRMVNIDEVLLLYRVWGGNMTHTQWTRQEHSAGGIAQRLAASRGVELSSEDALTLRDLSRERYPHSAAQLRVAAGHVRRWTEAILAEPRWNAADRAAAEREASLKLLLIGSLASWRSPLLALSVATSALQISAAAPIHFAAKTMRAVMARMTAASEGGRHG